MLFSTLLVSHCLEPARVVDRRFDSEVVELVVSFNAVVVNPMFDSHAVVEEQ